MDNFEQSAVQPPRTPPMDALSGTFEPRVSRFSWWLT